MRQHLVMLEGSVVGVFDDGVLECAEELATDFGGSVHTVDTTEKVQLGASAWDVWALGCKG